MFTGADLAARAASVGLVPKGDLIWYQAGTRLRPYGYPTGFVPNIAHQHLLVLRRNKGQPGARWTRNAAGAGTGQDAQRPADEHARAGARARTGVPAGREPRAARLTRRPVLANGLARPRPALAERRPMDPAALAVGAQDLDERARGVDRPGPRRPARGR